MRALEPGGPSKLFEAGGVIPVYPQLSALDVLDYADRTIWTEHAPPAGRRGPRPNRVIGEAGRLEGFADGSYDALLSSHVIEHLANPIGALRRWGEVVRPGGRILIVAPHLEGTFDHRRPVTTLDHLREDDERGTGEDDLTHLDEVVELHDLSRDPGSEDRETFERRARENPATRAMHHHTFTSRTLAATVAEAGLSLIVLKPQPPMNIICVCQIGATAMADAELERLLAASPFPADRR